MGLGEFIEIYKSLGPKNQGAKELLSRLGEFLVSYELTNRGYLVDYLANIRARETTGIDIMATSIKTNERFEIQAKTKVGPKKSKQEKTYGGWYFLKSHHNIGEKLGFEGWYAFVWISEDEKEVDYFIAHSSDVLEAAERSLKKYLAEKHSAKKEQPLMIHVSQLSSCKDNWGFEKRKLV